MHVFNPHFWQEEGYNVVSFVQCHTRSLWWQKVIQDGSTTFISNGIPQFLILLKKKKNKERRGQNQEVQNQSIQHHILHMTVLRSQNQDGFQIDQCCQSRCYLSYFLLKLNWLTSLPVYSLFIVLGDITLLLWEFVCKKNNKQNLGQ